MSDTTYADRAGVLSDLVRRARRAGILVKFDHDGLVVLENRKDAEAAQTSAAQQDQPATESAPCAP